MTLKQIVLNTLKDINTPISIPELANVIWKQHNNGKDLSIYDALTRTCEQGHVSNPKGELQNRIYAQNKHWKEICVDKTIKPHRIFLCKAITSLNEDVLIKKFDTFHLSFEISISSIKDFILHWEKKYSYPMGKKYDDNIGKPLTEISRHELFEWKNGSVISHAKLESIEKNYPLLFLGDKKERYLNDKQSGGAIWNIFYLHCLSPQEYPIYDQHTYRAMKYLTTKKIIEIGYNKKKIYESYINEYLPFIKLFGNSYDNRQIDKALFSFGQFLKIAKQYQ